MTSRERLALTLIALGAVALVTAAAAYGGWDAALAAAGALMLGGGVLLGLDTTETDRELPPGDAL